MGKQGYITKAETTNLINNITYPKAILRIAGGFLSGLVLYLTIELIHHEKENQQVALSREKQIHSVERVLTGNIQQLMLEWNEKLDNQMSLWDKKLIKQGEEIRQIKENLIIISTKFEMVEIETNGKMLKK